MSANKFASSRDADCIVREDRPEWAPWMTRKTLLAKPIHRWFTFPHSFTSELVYALIDDWGLSPRDRVLDPFVGAGTTVLAAKQRRIPARGYDISPLAQLVSRAKIADYQRSHLQVLLKVLCNAVASKRAQKAKCTGKSNFLAKALPGSRLRNFSLYVEAIDNLSCGSAERDFFKVALMAIVPAFSRARAAGGWLKWTGDHEEPGVFSEVFEDQVNKMLIDVEDQSTSLGQCWAVDAADARCIPDDDDTYTAVITSPPYPNRHDYTRVFGVELMVGFLTEAQTQRLRYESLRSHPEARVYTGEIAGYRRPSILAQILKDLARANVDARVRRMLDGYFQDIYQCLVEGRRVCKCGSKLAFVLGNVQYGGHSVPVDDLTAELGVSAGLRCRGMYVARYRGNSAQQMRTHGRRPSRETILVFEKR